ncbi:MAG TPA: large conductance mechanosensitive channel protein MscL [Burkholderiaceae bacterium]|nr:large conductance mechanosensitive channel protein MscL [Burkholderiaceae bacterium]
MSVLKEFRNFAVRGNVIDLAVGVIIGAAFGKIVDSIVRDLINPIIGAVIGKPDFTNLFWIIKLPEGYSGPMTYESLVKAGATVFGYGAFLTALINFLLLAFAIFFLVKFINKAKGSIDLNPASAGPSEDVLLLREIRDSLKR